MQKMGDGVSASVSLPLHHKVQKFSSGTGSPGWSQKKGCKTVVVCYNQRMKTTGELANPGRQITAACACTNHNVIIIPIYCPICLKIHIISKTDQLFNNSKTKALKLTLF